MSSFLVRPSLHPPLLAVPFFLCLSPTYAQTPMYIMLTHTVSLYPWGASAAHWALILKTEQIKVTVGRAEPAKDDTICQVYVCVCTCLLFFVFCLSWPLNSGTTPERAVVKWLPSHSKENWPSLHHFCRTKGAIPSLWKQARKQSDECSFGRSLIFPDEDYGIRFPLVPAGSVVTHLGLLLVHQCFFSDTWGFLFTHFGDERTAATETQTMLWRLFRNVEGYRVRFTLFIFQTKFLTCATKLNKTFKCSSILV